MIKTILTVTEWAIFVILLLLLFVVASPLLQNQVFISTYVVQSNSMEPTIMTGSIAVTRSIDASQVQEQDIITFTSPNNADNTIIHRVIAVENEVESHAFTTKGDNNQAADNWIVTPNLLKGKSVVFIPYLGFMVSYLKTVPGFAIGIGIPSLILAVFQVRKIRQGITEEVERRTEQALAKRHTNKTLTSLILIGFLFPLLIITSPRTFAFFSAETNLTGMSIAVADSEKSPLLSLELYDADRKARFTLQNVSQFSTIEYQLRFKGKGQKWDAIQGLHNNLSSSNEIVVADLVLGSCSDDACVYAADFEFPARLHQVFLDVTLLNEHEKIVLKTKDFASKE